jgi:PmbA protein
MNMKTEIFPDNVLAEEIDELLKELTAKQPDFIFSNKVTLQELNARMTNDNNLNLEHEDKIIEFSVLFKEKSSLNIMDGYFGFIERRYDRKLILEETNMILEAYKKKVLLPQNGKYPIICAANEIPVSKLITDLNSHLFATGSSLFSDKLNKKVFNEKFSFYQSLNPEDVFNMPFFDAEGVINKDYKFTFIDKGVIKGPYTDKRTANKYNLELTGTSSSAYDGVPELGFLNFKVKESENTLKELLKGEVGILVLIADGGDFTSSGDFGTPVQLAMLFDGEKLIGRLPEFQLSSNIYDMFGEDFRGVGKDKILPFASTKYAVIDMNICHN